MKQEAKWLPVIFLATSSLLLLPVFIYPADWAGWLLVYFSFALPLLFRRIRQDRKLLSILTVIIALHNAVSIYNVYGSTIYGAGLDAITFQEVARDLAIDNHPLWFAEFNSVEVGGSVYTRFLASFYRLFGVSLLLGQTLSVIAYTLSCIVLIYLAGILRFRYKHSLLILYGIPLPAIIYCSVIMREAWQVLFFMLVVYLTLRLRIAPSMTRAVFMLLAGLALGFLHNGLFAYSLVLLGLSIYWGVSGRWRTAGYKKVLIRAAILGAAAGALIVWIYLGGEIGGATRAIRSGEAVTYTETYRTRGEQDAAASYQVKVDTSSPLTFAMTSSLAFLYYQFAPFPWQARRPVDMYAAFESILRFVLLIYMFKLWWKAKGERRRRYSYLILCHLSLEFLWSLGTGNWGTAVRHHLVAYGVLVLLGTPGLMYSCQRLFRRLRFRMMKPSHPRRYEIKGIRVVN
jgi:hypothetical protein